jgi:hypothetical protein
MPGQALAEPESRCGAHQEKEIDEQNRDEDEAADEDVGPETHHGFVAGKIGRWDVFVLAVAFVMVFGHADKHRCKLGYAVPGLQLYERDGESYSSRPGRDISSRMASLGLLLW